MVMYHGRVVMVKAASVDLTREVIGEYMLGLKDDFNRIESKVEGDTGEK